jgi:hypothetical protein
MAVRIRKIGFWAAIALGTVIALPIAYLIAAESYLYLTQSPARAEAAARQEFVRACQREYLDADQFVGPKLIDHSNGGYLFAWISREKPDEEVDVTVGYLPFDLKYFLSDGIVDHKRDARNRWLTK